MPAQYGLSIACAEEIGRLQAQKQEGIRTPLILLSTTLSTAFRWYTPIIRIWGRTNSSLAHDHPHECR